MERSLDIQWEFQLVYDAESGRIGRASGLWVKLVSGAAGIKRREWEAQLGTEVAEVVGEAA